MKLDDIIQEYLWLIGYIVREKITAADVDDVIQTILCTICQNHHSIRDPEGIGSWIRTVVNNQIATYYRKKNRQQKILSTYAQYIGDACRFYDFLAHIETDATTLELLAYLPGKYKDVLVLRYLEEMTVHEISLQLGVAPEEISNRLSYAKKILRKKFSVPKAAEKKFKKKAVSATRLTGVEYESL
jgi:RNA polymerase sigma-70 factor, ECF subfamily